jgi:hypothetical protein
VATWGEVLRAVQGSAEQRGPLGPDLDGIRLGYINALRAISGRAVIVYASGWLGKSGFSDPALTVEPDDVHALMECCNGVEERDLDLIIHSPGGSLALEDDQQLQDAVLSIYHALDLTFRGPAIKVVENHLGRRKVRAIQPLVLQAAPDTQSGP